jgi:flagellar biogenesis protein FliO
MELVEVLQLGGKRQLMLVECDGRRYLVGAGGDSVHSIAEIGDEKPTSGNESGQ